MASVTIKSVLEYAESKGFVLKRSKKHYVLNLGKHTLTVSKTPSCPHAPMNAMRDIDRLLRMG